MSHELAPPAKPAWLAAASGTVKAAWRLLRGLAPVFLSREIVSHKKQKAEVDFVRHLMREEAKAIADVRAMHWKALGTASPEARFAIRRQLEQLDEDIRHFSISAKALDYLPPPIAATGVPTEPIAEHWMDRFLKLSRAANEPWRAELLARALAHQASGHEVSPKLLWTIGTLDYDVFVAVSYILDCSCIVAVEPGTETPIIPVDPGALMDEIATDYPNNPPNVPYRFGALVFMLQESGLIGEVFDNSIDLYKPVFTLRYGTETYRITKANETKRITLPGLMVTDLGRGLSQFHHHTDRQLGRRFFERALLLFSKKPFRKTRIRA